MSTRLKLAVWFCICFGRLIFSQEHVSAEDTSREESTSQPFSGEDARTFVAENCMDCHAQDNPGEGSPFFSLPIDDSGLPDLTDLDDGQVQDHVNASQRDSVTIQTWRRVLEVIRDREMPPRDVASLEDVTIEKMTEWIDVKLQDQSVIGGTPPRRLSRREYQATIESLFGMKSFTLPSGFPVDQPKHGFDNLGEGLVLSPALMDSYSEVATSVADQIFPPRRIAPKPIASKVSVDDLVISYSSAKVVNDSMRLGMKCDPISRSCTWPSRFEAKVSGLYEMSVQLSAFRPKEGSSPMAVKVLARDVSSNDSVSHRSLRLLKEILVTSESPRDFKFEAILYEGQTVVLHWANATLDSDREDKEDLRRFFEDKDRENPKYLAAWHAMLNGESGQGFRGGIGWERVKANLKEEDLALITAEQKEAVLKKIISNPVLYAETVVFDVYENGPAVEIHGIEFTGPIRIVDGPREETSRILQRQFLNESEDPTEIISNFLQRAFRRPVEPETLDRWLNIFDHHIEAGFAFDESMHLVIRKALISPRFLYRCLGGPKLDNHDLAARLSYFLTTGPPDEKLSKRIPDLGDVEVLRSEANRLLPTSPKAVFVKSFTEQWLETKRLEDIMPDRALKFSRQDQNQSKLEVEYFFAEILRDNRPILDFITPDFTWTTPRIAQNIYGIKTGFDKKKANDLQRMTFDKGGRYGGLLGMSAIMTATANGVDTQPVTRGVWLLEKILGQAVPPPPDAVPPLTPDTRGATNPRDLLRLHTDEVACARCHRRIDSFGLVLENFDPVGRWRDKWPNGEVAIDSQVTLFDGNEIKDVIELKSWLAMNSDRFGNSIANQLMIYATGRPMSYREQAEIAKIVKSNQDRGMGFRDLILDLICSPVFSAR